MEVNRSFAVEEYRGELRLFCYRMAASLQDAEGLVEATLFKAGGLPLPLTDVDSTRTELFKVAARLCMETLAGQPPRFLPHLSSPPSDPHQPPLPQEEGGLWLEPFPDDLYADSAHSGERRYAGRESISLPLIEALQSLAPPERMCLILSDVMGWEEETLMEILGAGAADTGNILERARRSMSRDYDKRSGMREPPPEDMTTELMMRYLYPWETDDLDALMDRLSEDAVLQLPPSPSWYEGREAVELHLALYPLQGEARGRWRLLPRRANGQLAFGVYQQDEARRIYHAHSIQVLHFTGERVSEIVAFAYPRLFPPFKLLPEITVQG
jgi:RNA polymerase sigma-70 factor (ECF subfamily)